MHTIGVLIRASAAVGVLRHHGGRNLNVAIVSGPAVVQANAHAIKSNRHQEGLHAVLHICRPHWHQNVWFESAPSSFQRTNAQCQPDFIIVHQ